MKKQDELWQIEEGFHGQDKKQHRRERRRISVRDRSQFKKTDQDQRKAQNREATVCGEGVASGRVVATAPEGIWVSTQGNRRLCQLRGSLKKEKGRIKNLIAVGDIVHVDSAGSIVHIEPRYSILSRADNLARNKQQLIAVNIDQVLIAASVVMPPFKPFLVDRYLIAACKGNMTPIIVINKIDLINQADSEEKALYEEFVSVYRALGFSVVAVSCTTKEGLGELEALMRGKTSVFSGQSGVGKSSLVNALTPSSLATGPVVERTRKGSHTTTTTHLIPLEGGGFCIDTPGIKSFGLWELKPEEVSSHFEEIFTLSRDCKYADCSHTNEPDCAVKRGVEEGLISSLRFASYCALIASTRQEHHRR